MSTTLDAEPRQKLGSRDARKLRAAGRIPISIQGEDKENVHASIDEHTFLLARRHHQHLFDISVEGREETAIVRELQYDSFGDRIVHVEFKRVVRGVAIESEVELEFTGRPKGGVVAHLVTHLTLRSLPSEIPDSVEVRVDGLEVGHTIHAQDLKLPQGCELVSDPELNVAAIAAPRGMEKEEEEAPAAEEGEAAERRPAAPTEEPSEGE